MIFIPQVTVGQKEQFFIAEQFSVISHNGKFQKHLIDFGIAITSYGNDFIFLFVEQFNYLRRVVQGRNTVSRSIDAVVVGVESRTSTPVRIPRNPETLMHDQIAGLFPAGEGAGYAGGIISAALDGERIATAVREYVK